jgi:type II secretory pathway component GspD/PulD (secretin)
MPRPHSVPGTWLLLLGILFLGFGYRALGQKIDEFDMGDANKKTTKAAPSTDAREISDRSQKTRSKGSAVISQVTASSKDNKAVVSIRGENLPKPFITKVSSNKLLIKFANAELEIPSEVKGDNQVVKKIRSSMHPGKTAWIVLDVSQVRTWDVSKSSSGYLIGLNSPADAAKDDTEKESLSIPLKEGSTEKGLFSRLTDASIKPLDKGIKIVFTSDVPSKYSIRKLSRPEKLVVRFRDTKLDVAEKLRKYKSNDLELQKGGLLQLEMRQIGPTFSPISEIILSVVPGTLHKIDRDLNQVVLTIFSPFSQEEKIAKKGNINQLVSLDVENADLNIVIKTLAAECGFDLDLAGGGTLAGNVSERLKDVPLKTALATLLAPFAYMYEVQGNTLRVGSEARLVATKILLPHITELISPAGGMTIDQLNAFVKFILPPTNAALVTMDTTRNVIIVNGTASDVEQYKKAIRDLKLDEGSGGDRITRVVKLNYAVPAEMSVILEKYLTPIGKVQIDARNNNLVIWESASNMGVLLELIKEIDVRSPQVLIESSIVEISDEKDLDLGIRWSADRVIGDPTIAASFYHSGPAGSGSLSFGTVKNGMNLSATLDALEVQKKGNVISRPRIATMSGVEAVINTVENVIIASSTSTLSNGVYQVTTTYSQLGLPIRLQVTPRITDDGRITTKIDAKITSQSGPAAQGAPPPTNEQTATTTITTKNGETIVIGGLVREIVTDKMEGIPLLSSLPILGALFQSHSKVSRKVELVIFITPTLLED